VHGKRAGEGKGEGEKKAKGVDQRAVEPIPCLGKEKEPEGKQRQYEGLADLDQEP